MPAECRWAHSQGIRTAVEKAVAIVLEADRCHSPGRDMGLREFCYSRSLGLGLVVADIGVGSIVDSDQVGHRDTCSCLDCGYCRCSFACCVSFPGI